MRQVVDFGDKFFLLIWLILRNYVFFEKQKKVVGFVLEVDQSCKNFWEVQFRVGKGEVLVLVDDFLC